jgi:hypothetical protein
MVRVGGLLAVAVISVASHTSLLGAAEPKTLSPPSFLYLPSQNDNSALSMDCDGQPPFSTLHCSFTQVTVSRSSQTEEKRQSFVKDLSSAPWTELQKTLAEMCPKLDGRAPEMLMPDPGSAKAASRAELISRARPLCACKDVTCARAEFATFFGGLERDQCAVWTNAFERDFTRAPGERKWVSNPGPQGLCNVVDVVVIESDESGWLWTYTQTRVTLDRSNKLCESKEPNLKMVYSSHAVDTGFAKCSSIKFGL